MDQDSIDILNLTLKTGNQLHAKGEHEEAIATFRKGLATLDRVAASNPGDPLLNRYRLTHFALTGDVLCQLHRPDEAIAAYKEALAIIKPIASTSPADKTIRRDLYRTYGKIGEAWLWPEVEDKPLGIARRREAMNAYMQCYATIGDLIGSEPENPEWKEAMATCQQRMSYITRLGVRM
jgi:tetratricopeptide (TPR) repeat protein